MSTDFVHLRLHTEFSLRDGLVRVKPLMQRLVQAGMPAVAVTDQGNLFAMVRFYKAALNAGIKPLIGADLWLRGEGADGPWPFTLLCMDPLGYRNLTDLVTRAYQEGQVDDIPYLERAWLEGHTAGLIALSGGQAGEIGAALQQEDTAAAEAAARWWSGHFPGRFYIELQRVGRANEEPAIGAATRLAVAQDLPVVATNDVRFLDADDFEAHEVRVCIHQGYTLEDPNRPRRYTDQQYLKSPAAMAEAFADLPEALENTVEIAKRCNLVLEMGQYHLPDFPVPEHRDVSDHLAMEARTGLARRLQADREAGRDGASAEAYQHRLEHELGVIEQMGFPGYFLIVADFIQWAKEAGIPVGPGRGSGAGSLVAYALRITDLDPLRYDLLFERFLNPERVSMPDFDVDFCMENRDRVIDYVAERYGRDKVSQIITYGTMAARAVVRDVGRVLGYSYGFMDRIAKMIPFEVGMTLDKALEQAEDFKERYDNDEAIRSLIDMGKRLEGVARNAGKHAGGVVIAPSPLTDFVPLYCEPGGEGLVTQLDKDDVESMGLVKFDFLGLRTLTIIDWAVENANRQRAATGEAPLDLDRIPLDDAETFRLLQEARTTAVFQLESRGMKDLIRRQRPDSFEDIIALVALFRPGPLQSGMVDDFINRKHGRAAIEYPHPSLEEVLKPTYGVILYQEQVMQIAQVMAGYSLGGADLLRRAMGKKKLAEMAEQRTVFIEGAEARGVDADTATSIFDLIEKFAGYGFNKSHSAAYALLSYQTGWLKAHYPSAFMAAVLSADLDHTDKIVNFVDACRQLGLTVQAPAVNRSEYAFTPVDAATIDYGLGAIKGVGQGVVEDLIAARRNDGVFTDLDDLCRRLQGQRLNRRALEALIRAGALDGLGPNRASLMAHLPEAFRQAEQWALTAAAGQDDLFGLMTGGDEAVPDPIPTVPDWDPEERLAAEKDVLGFYLTGHPVNAYRDELQQLTGHTLAGLAERIARDGERDTAVAGLISALRTRTTAKGKEAFVTLDDGTGRIEARVFPEPYRAYREALEKDRLIIAVGRVSPDDYTGGIRLRVREIHSLAAYRVRHGGRVQLELAGDAAGEITLEQLAATLDAASVEGGDAAAAAPVVIAYRGAGFRVRLRLSERWRLPPDDSHLKRLRQLPGVAEATMVYGAPTNP